MSLNEDFSQERAWRRGPGILPGADVERTIFGSPIVSPNEKHHEHMPFAQAIRFAKEHQPNTLRRSRVVRELRAKVAELCEDKTAPVKFFTAVDTPLDVYHGADAFFEQEGRIATIDISLHEKSGHKADALVVATLDKEGRVIISDEEMAKAAKDIARRLNAKSFH